MISKWLYILAHQYYKSLVFLPRHTENLSVYLCAGVKIPSPITTHTITHFLLRPNCKDRNMLLWRDRRTQTQFGRLLSALSTLQIRMIRDKSCTHPLGIWQDGGRAECGGDLWISSGTSCSRQDQPLHFVAQDLFHGVLRISRDREPTTALVFSLSSLSTEVFFPLTWLEFLLLLHVTHYLPSFLVPC